MKSQIKFQCRSCQGIVATDFDDEFVSCGHCNAPCQVPQSFGPGVVIDDFVVLHLLGEGGMGNVYLAHQFSLDRDVALKILKPRFLQDPKFKDEFIYEARSVARLNHPNIIQAFKVGEEDGGLFFAMEYVEGQNLKDVLKSEGSLSEERVVDIAIDIAEALGYAWNQSKLIHRDIKPDNIMIANDGTAKLMDLGLSRRDGDKFDEGDMITGTPQYISPEQIMGADMDIRGDFYSLGATLYHLASGKYPFDGPLEEMIRKHLTQPPPSLKKAAPEVSVNFVKIVSKMLAKKPEERFQSSDTLVRELKRDRKKLSGDAKGKKHITVKNVPVTAPVKMTTGKTRLPKKKKQDPLLILGLIVGLIITAGLIIILMMTGDDSPEKVKKTLNKPAEISNNNPEQTKQPQEQESQLSLSENKENLSAAEKSILNSPFLKKSVNLQDSEKGLYVKVLNQKIDDTKKIFMRETDQADKVASFNCNYKGLKDNFALCYVGFIKVPITAKYTFILSSDDHGELVIGGERVVSTKTKTSQGNILLQSGYHRFVFKYTQHGGARRLKLEIQAEDLKKQEVNASWFYRKKGQYTGKAEEKKTLNNTSDEASYKNLVPFESEWYYYDGLEKPSEDWQTAAYVTQWKKGQGKFGYGEKVNTELGLAKKSTPPPICYFRKDINLKKGQIQKPLQINVKYEDGFVCYINGHKVKSENVKSDNIYAKKEKRGESNFSVIEHLKTGPNSIAFQIHNTEKSKDLSFDAHIYQKNSQVANLKLKQVSTPSKVTSNKDSKKQRNNDLTINYTLYGAAKTLADLGKDKKTASGTISKIEFLPEMGDSFGLIYRGKVNIPKSGKYKIKFQSVNAGILRINGKKIAESSGKKSTVHPELVAGVQNFVLQHINEGKKKQLKIEIWDPDNKKLNFDDLLTD